MAREKQFPFRITLPLTGEMLRGVDSALGDGEVRLDLIRQAIDRELKRRARTPKPPPRQAKPD